MRLEQWQGLIIANMTIDLLPDRMVVEEGHFDDHTDDADDSGESS